MKSLVSYIAEAKAPKVEFVDTPEAKEELNELGKFDFYTSNSSREDGKIIIGHNNDGAHFMIKPSSAKMLDKAKLEWSVSEYELKKAV